MKKFTLVWLLVFCTGGLLIADDEPASLEEALVGGKVDFNLRARVEIIEKDGKDGAQAWTERIRLGYTTQTYNGFTIHVDMEDIRTADDDRYNAGGTNANGKKAKISDIPDTELNQAFIKYVCESGITIIGGRQRIILDDARFIGNVGWRQNEQTFDAGLVAVPVGDNVTARYAYIWDVNRIFGPDAGKDLTSNTQAINVAFDGLPEELGKVTGFAYLIDVDESPGLSSDTYGVRLVGKNKINDKTSFKHILSYATQSEGNNNPTGYDADYYLVEGTLTKKDVGSIGMGYEVLGSDSGTSSFQTPLATGHKFNGLADIFLTTPDEGLVDHYIFAKANLFGDILTKLTYHWFRGEDSGGSFGEEIDLVATKKLTKNSKVKAKFVWFDGTGKYKNTVKTVFQWELAY